MRTLTVSEFVTLDGVMEAPGGETSHPHTGWVRDYQSPEQVDYKFKEVLEADMLLLGRVTYESFAGAWPHYTGALGEFADRMNGIPKVVVSNTLTDPEWSNTTVLAGDPVAGVAKLNSEGDGRIVVGGSHTLVHALLDNDLVDELRLMVFPVTIGSGLRVFPETTRKRKWEMIDTVTFPTRVRVDTYHPEVA
jgi:dihydrofolate reductase